MTKKCCLVVFALMCIGFCMSSAYAEYQYVGNRRTRVFHYTTCEWAHRIKDYNKIYLGPKDAYVRQGFRPCPSCRP